MRFRLTLISGDRQRRRGAGVAIARQREGSGLSFEYRARGKSGSGLRGLLELDLFEVSLVANPMPKAWVHAVESWK